MASQNQETKLYDFSRPINSAYSTKVITDINFWHGSQGHINVKLLKSLPGYVEDVKKITDKVEPCHACQLGKAKEKSFDFSFETTKYHGEVVLSNLCGKLPNSIDGSRYFYTFIDQHTRFMHIVGLRKKNEKAEVFEQYKVLSHVKKYFGSGVERPHTEGSREYENVKVGDHPYAYYP